MGRELDSKRMKREKVRVSKRKPEKLIHLPSNHRSENIEQPCFGMGGTLGRMSSPDSNLRADVECLFNELAARPTSSRCRKYRWKMIHVDTAFFSPGPNGKLWTIALPVCPKCVLKDDTAQSIPLIAC